MTREQALLHTRAGVLGSIFPQFVAPFEAELVEDIRRRRAAFGDAARITEAEAHRLEDLLTGLEASARRLFQRADVKVWFETRISAFAAAEPALVAELEAFA